jgi:hypothetical protein
MPSMGNDGVDEGLEGARRGYMGIDGAMRG